MSKPGKWARQIHRKDAGYADIYVDKNPSAKTVNSARVLWNGQPKRLNGAHDHGMGHREAVDDLQRPALQT